MKVSLLAGAFESFAMWAQKLVTFVAVVFCPSFKLVVGENLVRVEIVVDPLDSLVKWIYWHDCVGEVFVFFCRGSHIFVEVRN